MIRVGTCRDVSEILPQPNCPRRSIQVNSTNITGCIGDPEIPEPKIKAKTNGETYGGNNSAVR